MRPPRRRPEVHVCDLRTAVPELAGNLKERSFECFRIGAYVAAAHRSLYARQLDVELVGELVAQTMRRYPEGALFNTAPLHPVLEALEGLLQRQAWMPQM